MHMVCRIVRNFQKKLSVIMLHGCDKFVPRFHCLTCVRKNMSLHKELQSTNYTGSK